MFKKFSEKDITYVLTIRVSDFTPWILERIKFCLNFYEPCPKILILDFGSEEKYSLLIEDECKKSNATYVKINDTNTFSASKAKNLAFKYVTTDLILFSDIDCVFSRDIFQTLAKDATLLEFNVNPRRYITFPVIHLAENISKDFEELEPLDKEKYIRSLDYYSLQAEFKKEIEFIAPYSNILFMHKNLYELSGGYCDIFRGHGSEDFEYLIRLGYLTSDLPKPKNLNKDFYGPLKESFWNASTYEGFRKYLEALTFTSAYLGYKTYHMWHPKPSEKGYWTNNNDWKRERFNKVLGIYLQNEEKILEIDYLVRNKKALCLMNDIDQWGYFLPFRAQGYALEVASSSNQAEINQAYKKILRREVDLVCIFNPYMKSHKDYYALIELAKENSIPVKIIERGALPNTIYYANEVSYNDSDFYDEDHITNNILNKNLNVKEKESILRYISKIRTGKNTLENMQDYEDSIQSLHSIINKNTKNIFIPFQLPDDMAVTYFNENNQNYNDFTSDIKKLALKYSEIMFYIKPHPLMPNINSFENYTNIILLNNINIHAILDVFDHIILYNSGVGLLSILHGKKPYCIGNAFYSLNGRLATKVVNLEQAIQFILDSEYKQNLDEMIVFKFITWLCEKKYSTFQAEDKIRDFGDRLSHGYKNIQVQKFSIDNTSINIGNHKVFPYSEKSFISAKVIFESKTVIEDKKSAVSPQKFSMPFPFLESNKKVRKLIKNPKGFFLDAVKNKMNFLDN